MRGAALEQAVREAAGRGADVERAAPGDPDAERVQGVGELHAAARDVRRRRVDVELDRGVHELPGLLGAAPAGAEVDLAGQHGRGGARPGSNRPRSASRESRRTRGTANTVPGDCSSANARRAADASLDAPRARLRAPRRARRAGRRRRAGARRAARPLEIRRARGVDRARRRRRPSPLRRPRRPGAWSFARCSGADAASTLDGLLTGADGTSLDEAAAPAAEGLQAWSAPASSVLRQRPGHYYWQAYLTGDRATGRAADRAGARARRHACARRPRPRQAVPALRPARRRGVLPLLGGLPRRPSTARASRRWPRRPRRAGACALLRWTERPSRRPGRLQRRRLLHEGSGRRAGPGDRLRRGTAASSSATSRCRADENWSAGPDYPALDQIDLESVLLHELGHMAGNKRHRARCSNSPMIESLGAGEWWRGARDHWFGDCASGARASSARTLVRRSVRVD